MGLSAAMGLLLGRGADGSFGIWRGDEYEPLLPQTQDDLSTEYIRMDDGQSKSARAVVQLSDAIPESGSKVCPYLPCCPGRPLAPDALRGAAARAHGRRAARAAGPATSPSAAASSAASHGPPGAARAALARAAARSQSHNCGRGRTRAPRGSPGCPRGRRAARRAAAPRPPPPWPPDQSVGPGATGSRGPTRSHRPAAGRPGRPERYRRAMMVMAISRRFGDPAHGSRVAPRRQPLPLASVRRQERWAGCTL